MEGRQALWRAWGQRRPAARLWSAALPWASPIGSGIARVASASAPSMVQEACGSAGAAAAGVDGRPAAASLEGTRVNPNLGALAACAIVHSSEVFAVDRRPYLCSQSFRTSSSPSISPHPFPIGFIDQPAQWLRTAKLFRLTRYVRPIPQSQLDDARL